MDGHTGKRSSAIAVLYCAGAAMVFLAGCTGAPPGVRKAETPESTVSSEPSASEVILDSRLLAQNSDFESAAVKLENLVEREGTNIEALRLLASVYSALELKDKSSAMWERVAMLDPADAEAAYEIGISLARNKKWSDLRSRMSAAEAAGVSDPRLFLLRGEAALELGYRGEAQKYLARASVLERANYMLGKLFYNQGRYAKAEEAFRNVIADNPVNQPAHLHLGFLEYHKGNMKRALKHYGTAVKLNPSDPLATLSLAALFEEMKRPSEAIRHYRKGLTLRGIHRDRKRKAYISLNRLLLAQNRTGEVIATVRKGLAEFPNSGGLHFFWGEALLREGRRDEARTRFKQAARDPIWKELALKRLHSI